MKTKFSSYAINNISKGCQQCVKGQKLVLFISGICKVNCYYCSLSNKRKNKNICYANEREIKNEKELIQEAIESNAKGAGITGGDPLLFLNKTIKYASALKKHFGKKFHLHIYLPTKNVTKQNLKQLSKVIDEVRFHPNFLVNQENTEKDIKKIRLAKQFFKKQNIGIELPMIPEKKQEIFNLILKLKDTIGFSNLNEFELSETNFNIITKKYDLNKQGYVIKKSKPAGLWILKQAEKNKLKTKIHFCTANLKNKYQYLNRLKLHKILPYGKKTEEGTVIYLTICSNKNWNSLKKQLKNQKEVYFDEKKKRAILSQKTALKLINKYLIERIEEYPTYDSIEIEREKIIR